MSQNQAAWITSAGAYPFTIDKAPFPKPGPGQVVIKNAAIAIVCSCLWPNAKHVLTES